MELNIDLIKSRCQEITDSIERLDKIKTVSKKKFLENQDTKDIASYRLMIAIEAALNLCYHISAKKLKKVPNEYAECFEILGNAKIIPDKLATELKKMARFRNLLVHMYWKMDYEIVYDILKNNLKELDKFSKIVIKLV